MRFLKILLKNSTADSWGDGVRWALWSLGALLPIWATLLILELFAQQWSISVLYDQGEFVLYASSFFAVGLHIITREFSKNRFPSQGVLVLVFVIGLMATTIVYSAVQTVVLVPGISSIISLDDRTLGAISWIVMPGSVLLSMVIVVVENIRLTTDVSSARNDDLKKLNRDFDSLGENDDG